MRWGVTFSALLFNLVFTMEVFLLTKNLLTFLIAHPDSWRLCAPLRAGCALLRSDAALGPHAHARPISRTIAFGSASSYSPLILDLPNRGGPAPRARPRVLTDSREVPAVMRAGALAPGDASAARHIPYAAHVAPEVIVTTRRVTIFRRFQLEWRELRECR